MALEAAGLGETGQDENVQGQTAWAWALSHWLPAAAAAKCHKLAGSLPRNSGLVVLGARKKSKLKVSASEICRDLLVGNAGSSPLKE